MSGSSITPGFADVDRAPDPRALLGYLDRMSALDWIQALKRRTLDLLDIRPGMRCLDVGCGLGADAAAMAERAAPGGSVVGVDASAFFIEEGRRRLREAASPASVTLQVADGCALPFEDGGFDRVRGERYLQVVSDPERALSEMVRVCAPGGLVLEVDADFGTMAVDAPPGRVSEAILGQARGNLRNPWMGRQLRRRMLDAGLVDVAVHAAVSLVVDPAVARDAMRLDDMAHRAVEAALVSAAEADQWLEDLREQGERGRFLASQTGFMVVGRRPG